MMQKILAQGQSRSLRQDPWVEKKPNGVLGFGGSTLARSVGGWKKWVQGECE